VNLHERGQAFQNRVTRSTAGTGVSALYARGEATVPLVATPTREQPDGTTVPSPGTRSADRQRDYILVLADLVAAGFNLPAEGDRITETLNGSPVVFEVVKNRTEPAWRWYDQQRTRVIVHTREQA
jgi:hypothetical protein